MELDPESRQRALTELADPYLGMALKNITREFPVYPWYVATRPGTYPTHREAHPVFYGSFDWHSCVEMHWVIVRLLRLVPEAGMATRAIEQLDALITPEGMEREHAFFLDPDLGNFERPYGWGWYLTLDRGSGPAGRVRTVIAGPTLLRPLAETLEAKFLRWLPKLTYPQRMGMHPNTAFALTLALSWANLRADEGDASLRDAIEMAAIRFFLRDTDYPAHYEPSGADFLSPALTEAVLMRRALELDDFLSLAGRISSRLAGRTTIDSDSGRCVRPNRWTNRAPARPESQPCLGMDGPFRSAGWRRPAPRANDRERPTARRGVDAVRRR